MSFENQIQKWITLDNQIKSLNEKIKHLREEKSRLNEDLIDYAGKNDLVSSTIKVGSEKLKFINTRVPEPITFKYLEKTLSEIIKNENQVKIIIDYIKKNREIKSINELKRY